MKKFLSFVLAALLLFSMLPAASAEGSAPYAASIVNTRGGLSALSDAQPGLLVNTAASASARAVPISSELEEAISNIDVTSILNEMKSMLYGSASMSEEEIRQQVTSIAAQYGIPITDEQIDQLLSLSRMMDQLDPDALKERVEDIQGALHKVADAKTKVVGFMQTIGGAVDSIRCFFDRIFDMIHF